VIIVNQSGCPKCRCRYMKKEGFFYICFRCGTTYDQDGVDLDEIIKLSLEGKSQRGNHGKGQI
jgi:hypothetical protein